MGVGQGTDPIDATQIPEPGLVVLDITAELVVLDITAEDEATARAVMTALERLWAYLRHRPRTAGGRGAGSPRPRACGHPAPRRQ
ncbi:hypothetical protein ACIBBB_34895 [Streptomyces sp. NPDC051217]|uniref:hypothetical protein n=1 Tax=Streptomyces sp. NPDC051217 TaxID=3365644 RepID=UPI003788CBEB